MTDTVIQVACAFFAVLMFAAVLEVPREQKPLAALCGAIAWWSYLMIYNFSHSSLRAAFVSTLVVAVISHRLARIRKAPVTVFLIPGILPAVPGAAIYRCVYYLIRNNSYATTYYLTQTLQIAGAMAMAIFITDSFSRLFQLRHENREKRP